jgi:lysophospholipase L1-like esterase
VPGWNLQEIAGCCLINKGVNGEQSFEKLSRFDHDVIAVNPRAFIIWGYINDIFRSERENLKVKMDAARDHLRKMVFTARVHRIHPILATEITICGPSGFRETAAAFAGQLIGKESYQDYVNKHVRAVNQWVREYSRANNVILLDFELVLSNETGARKKEYTEKDGSHISPRGYDELNSYVLEHITSFRVDECQL